MEHPKTPERADAITRLLARRVAELRKAVGMSQVDLGFRMAELRPGWSRSTVAKLEKNLRESLSVGDLMALAVALDVPPTALIADPRAVETVPVADGVEPDAWSALLWLIGAATLDDEPGHASYDSAAQIINYGAEFSEACRNLTQRVRVARGSAERDQQATDDLHRRSLDSLVDVLQDIRKAGAKQPPVPQYVVDRARELGVELPSVEA